MRDGAGFDGLGRELRERAGAQLRAEAEDSERLAAQAARRGRSLADVARELMARGDTVTVAVPGRWFTGVIIHASGDLLTLRAAGGSVDVNLRAPAHLQVVQRARSGGLAGSDGASSFKARLFEIEMAGELVTLGCLTVGEEVRGRIAAVGVDHLVWQSGGGREWYLPLVAVTHVLHAGW